MASYSAALLALLAVLASPSVRAALVKPQKNVATTTSNPAPAKARVAAGCVGCNQEKDSNGISITDTIHFPLHPPPHADDAYEVNKGSCTCTTTPEEDCLCNSECSEEQKIAHCTEVLGPCTCAYQDASALCDCNGYCHTREDRADACEEEPGCLWKGQWCDTELGIVWQ
eukprot:gnl/TRDRNA2_/TRDRNA2_185775_c0_seq1.p2 gnl/TRDRNA2_/TRDRNA2_185775_c0~~gnl/TRDRNA2_/TRDRNA2_185775_c0_seq1.p2  ORF type:complete len:170 (+),score=37.64 gnl/TRDRNA2_/TRDRNA2_185775_c0_seq1:83-592(+)